MNWRKYMLLIVGGSISLVLLVGTLVFLMQYREKYVDVKERMENALRTLDRLRNRDPFPSQENVNQARQNKKDLEAFRATLLSDLRRGQAPTQDMEPAQFRQFLEETLSGPSGLRLAGRSANVALPDLFAFGFDRYVRGALPEPEHIPRLVDQLNMVNRLCEMLYEARIAELQSITREKFELEVEGAGDDIPELSARSSRRRRGTAAPEAAQDVKKEAKTAAAKKLYTREPISLTFFARESALWAVLNELAKNERFMAVTEVEILTETAKGARGAAARPRSGAGELDGGAFGGPATGAPEMPLSHDERVVAGQERILVRLSVEVYHFGTDDEEGDKGKEATP